MNDYELRRGQTRRATLAKAGAAAAGAAAVAGLARPGLAQASTTNPFIVVDQGGQGDYTDFEVAVASTPANSTIFVRRGTYVISDSIRPATGVRIVGEGYGAVIRAKNGFNKNPFFIENNYVVLENLNIDGNKANQQSNKSNVDFQGVTGGRVVNCFVHDAGGYNIVCYPGGTELIVSGNRVLDATQDGIEMMGTSNSTIVGNTVINCGNGIQLWNNTGVAAHNAVVGNTVRNCPNMGIVVQDGAHDNVIVGNAVDAAGVNGIFIGNGGNGVTNPANGNLVSGNTVANSVSAGIRLNGVSECVISQNLLRANGGHGVWLRYSEACSVNGNTATANKGSGIRIEGYPGSPTRLVTVEGNVARNNGQDSAQNGDGVSIYGPSQQVSVGGNVCSDSQATKTQRHGVSFEDTTSNSDGILFNSNLVRGNRAEGLAILSLPAKTHNVPFCKVAANVGATETAVPHGLGYAPQAVTVTMRSPGTIWQSRAADATSVYLTADASGRQADVIVG
jgi:parallel beta-helix repeat protein